MSDAQIWSFSMLAVLSLINAISECGFWKAVFFSLKYFFMKRNNPAIWPFWVEFSFWKQNNLR